ncbi:MAG: aldo/keto reductase [Streptosporangiaceae bacterium]
MRAAVRVTLLDTADGHRAVHSERVLGRALAGQRDEVVITTKRSDTGQAAHSELPLIKHCGRAAR